MRNTALAYLLWCSCFLGLNGVHRIYSGKYFSGLVWLFTLGFFGVGQVVDLFLIPGMVERKNLRYLLYQRENNQTPITHEVIVNLTEGQKYSEPAVPAVDKKSDIYTILKLAKDNPQGISVADCVIATDKPIAEIKELLNNLYKEGLLHIDNHEETGTIIYRIV
ncbi:MAG: NINE protein [Lyngbya sp.]|nr:NINE protein [Lyngbya sp.]